MRVDDNLLPDSIEVYDSEDEDLQRALDESLKEFNTAKSVTEADVTDIIRQFQETIDASIQQEMIISRKYVLKSAFRALQRPFNKRSKIYIKFSGEMGLDHGGPTREFFRLVLQELSMDSMFAGPEGSKLFFHDMKKLEEKEYFMAGQLIALSILHDGPGFNTLNEHLCHLMLGGHSEDLFSTFDIKSIEDEEWKGILCQLKEADNIQKIEKFLCEHGDWLISQGYSNAYRLKVEDVETTLTMLIKQFIYYRTLPEITQFCDGMSSVNFLWELLKTNPKAFLSLFCHRPRPLVKEVFISLFNTSWSEEGSNSRNFEDDTIYSWEVFLQNIEDKIVDVTFEDLLVFITGADKIPPCGFSSKISIQFYNQEEGNVQRLPFASTCALILYLPRGINNPDDFSSMMLRAVKESCGFGKI